jgi:hypothetical protein
MLGRIRSSIDDATWRVGLRLHRTRRGDAALVPAAARRDGKFLVGRNGRLFLANDSHRVVDQHVGRLTFSDQQLEAWRAVLEDRAQRLAKRGCAYLMLVVPDAHSVYPEDLPRGMPLIAERPVHRLLGYLSKTGCTARVVYPLEELLERKREQEVYPRTDSHWNEAAAFAAYGTVAAVLSEGAPMRVIDEDEVASVKLPGVGDLGIKRRWPRQSPHLFGYMRHSSSELVADNRVEGTGSVIVSRCATAPAGTCVICGDSYTHGVLDFMAQSFGRVVFAQVPALDWTLVEREQPDAVLTVICERFLIEVPDDAHAPPTDVLAAAKFAEGRVRPWRMERWSGERHVSPAEVERVRAGMLAEGRQRDAAMVCTLAYAGVFPTELLRLRWRHLKATELRVLTDPRDGSAGRWRRRRVPLLEPLQRDLVKWRDATESPGERDLMFPPETGVEWDRADWRRWIDERYEPIAADLGLVETRPGNLRATYDALRINAGATLSDLEAELGVSLEQARAVYSAHLARVAEAGYVSAEAEIERARRLAARTLDTADRA